MQRNVADIVGQTVTTSYVTDDPTSKPVHFGKVLECRTPVQMVTSRVTAACLSM